METVIFPDTRALCIGYLNSLLDVPVRSEVPGSRPPAFVRILTAGGAGMVNPALDDVALTVEAWADSDGEAHDLAQRCRAHLRNASTWGDTGVYGYNEWGTAVSLPDESRQSRFTFTFSIRVRGRRA